MIQEQGCSLKLRVEIEIHLRLHLQCNSLKHNITCVSLLPCYIFLSRKKKNKENLFNHFLDGYLLIKAIIKSFSNLFELK